MKAFVYHRYGLPEVLELVEVERPVPKDDEVLVRVQAVSLNASDWEMLTGRPVYTRIWGLSRPKVGILGSDIAGRVEAVGSKATRFQPGDEVFGDLMETWGGFAECVCAPEKLLSPKPAGMSFEAASALPQAAVIALQGLRDKGRLQAGESVLVNGAGGGAGSFAVQIARTMGAEVTGVDSARKQEFMRKLGADRVIDYGQEDFTRTERRYDLILDFVGHHSLFDFRRALAPKGRYVMVGGSVGLLVQTLLLGWWIGLPGGKRMGVLAARYNEGLDHLTELIAAGDVTPAVDRVFPFHEVPEALRTLGEGRALGKLVVTLDSNARA